MIFGTTQKPFFQVVGILYGESVGTKAHMSCFSLYYSPAKGRFPPGRQETRNEVCPIVEFDSSFGTSKQLLLPGGGRG